MTSRLLWLDPRFGVAGDMLLGLLHGLGADPDTTRRHLEGLGVTGWSMAFEPTTRAGISSLRAVITADEQHQAHRSWSSIDTVLADAALPEPVAAGARRTFEHLARAEAAIHRVEVDQVHFHEVGAVDAIVDIVGSWSALVQLDVDRVLAGPVGLGNGTVSAAHGELPVPAPATLDLLEDIPVRPVDVESETATPTGAALLRTMVDEWGAIPAGRLVTSARGAGGRNPDTHPNVVTGILVEHDKDRDDNLDDSTPSATGDQPGSNETTTEAVVLATNLDDATPEVIGHTIGRLLEAGADDAWVVPIVMKKNRPGHELRVLTKPSLAPGLRRIVFTETGTLGIRTEPVSKHILNRVFRTVEVRGHTIRVKVGPFGAKPEHDDLVVAAVATRLPIRVLAAEAQAGNFDTRSDVWHQLGPQLRDEDGEPRSD